MNFKINTKDIFNVISINEEILTANMSVILVDVIDELQKDSNKSLIIQMDTVMDIEEAALLILVQTYERMYKQKCSFVLCGLSIGVKTAMNKKYLLEKINHTLTESEAWDIVQMEEIERELGMDFE